jgi:hypothetical protein
MVYVIESGSNVSGTKVAASFKLMGQGKLPNQ